MGIGMVSFLEALGKGSSVLPCCFLGAPGSIFSSSKPKFCISDYSHSGTQLFHVWLHIYKIHGLGNGFFFWGEGGHFSASYIFIVKKNGPKPTRFLCPWNDPGKSTGVGSHSLLQGIFPTQESNPGLLQILYHLSHRGSRG